MRNSGAVEQCLHQQINVYLFLASINSSAAHYFNSYVKEKQQISAFIEAEPTNSTIFNPSGHTVSDLHREADKHRRYILEGELLCVVL